MGCRLKCVNISVIFGVSTPKRNPKTKKRREHTSNWFSLSSAAAASIPIRMAASSIMESFFQRSLDDLIKGIRHQVIGESNFISKSLEDIRREIKSTDPHTKSIALEKLTYLNSLHSIDMSWAAFHVVEVMSSTSFSHKKIAYNAISQSFNESTDVLLLITNQLRKDLTSTNEFEVSLALESLSIIATNDLAKNLTPEIYTLLGSSKVLVKKKAIGVVLRVFSKYPDAARVLFKRLVENLETSDPQVMSAAIGVFCELTSRDPISYLPLAPEFYRVLVDCKNNWVLIKVIKIFAKLAPLEPRLAKRVVDPICDHIRRTTAKSLMFECVRTVVSCLTDYKYAVKLAVEKVKELLGDEDPNLKYLGLQALSILGSKCLWAVVENKEAVIRSLSDGDPNIRLESLHLVMEMVKEDNVVEICRVLVNYALKADPEFCNEIIGSILSTCSKNVYEVIVDFGWYVSLLGEISRNPHCQKGDEIERQLVDIGLRVKEVRPELVHVSRDLLIDPALLGNPFLHRILSAAAWASGEYVEFSRNSFELMEALLQPRTNLLPPMVRAVYVQSAFKVLVSCLQTFFTQSEEAIPSASFDGLVPGISDLVSKKEYPESFDLAKGEASAGFDQEEEWDPMLPNRATEICIAENGEDETVREGQASDRACSGAPFTHDSIVHLLTVIETALSPLSESDDVEVLERVRNVLGLAALIRQEIPGCLVERESSLEKEEHLATKIVDLLNDAFLEELAPVSITAQERVPVPEGLTFNEDLADLDAICGDFLNPPPSSPFSTRNRLFGENDGLPLNLQKEEESGEPSESTSLLAQHRKRHGLYYLPSEKMEIGPNDYPPANDPQSSANITDDAQDLLKITEQSLFSKKKPAHTKPRPVVVNLDEGDERPILSVKSLKELEHDSLSGAVRDILLGNEAKPMSSQSKPADKSLGKRMVKEVPQQKEYMGDVHEVLGSSSSRRNKQHGHGKERHRSHKRNDEGKDETSLKDKSKSHGRSKTRHRADASLSVQTPVIPDFLL